MAKRAEYKREEQLRLQKKAVGEWRAMRAILNDREQRELIDDFKNRFNICETVCKVFLQAYKPEEEKKDLKLNMSEIPTALRVAGYTFSKDLLTHLFGSDKTVAGNTAKILRNRLTHGFSKAAVEEIKRRKEELFGYMDLFLETILNADLTEKK